MISYLILFLIPLFMILWGFRFLRGKLPEIQRPQLSPIPGIRVRGVGLTGFRTRRSMLSPATWVFAHRFLGRLWFIFGLLTLLCTSAVVLLSHFHGAGIEENHRGFLMIAQLAMMLLPMLFTEIALRYRFDAYGRPRI